MLRLVIGNRNYSSWSLRAWLYLRESGLPFDETRLDLFGEAWASDIAAYSPAGRVPVLLDGPVCVWDSMAIMDYLLEQFPDAVGWPADPGARAHARSISAEMHSGFLALRGELPMNIRRRTRLPRDYPSAACLVDIERIDDIWRGCRAAYHAEGSWLFGGFSIADVMYAPVALRFRTYGVEVSAAAAEYMETTEALPAVREWCDAAVTEPESAPVYDEIIPAVEHPG